MALEQLHRPTAIADRIGEIVALLYFEHRRCRRAPKAPREALRRMLTRLKMEQTSFGKRWPVLADKLALHARRVCKPQPRCGSCPLVSFCETGQGEVRRNDGPVAVDIFAGAGGLGSGFRRAGFRIGLAVENDRNAAQTYRFNNPGTPVFEIDADKIIASWLLRTVGKRPEVVCAGPPCQSFSAAGARDDNDPRHHLFRHVLNLAHDVDPDIVVIENVPGVALRLRRKRNYRDIIADELGRRFEPEVLLLEATDYGVPQLRRRYIFIGRRRGSAAIGQPPKTHSINKHRGLRRTPTVLEALDGLPRRRHGCKKDWYRRKDGFVLHNLTTMTHSKRVIAKMRGITGGEGPISYRRIPRVNANTLIAGHRALPVHPTLHRTISAREAACVQSFPENYVFLGPPANQPLQVANAVPPPLAEAIARSIRAHLDGA